MEGRERRGSAPWLSEEEEGGRHPRRGRRGELLSHEGECSVEVAAGLLAGGWRRHGWKERGSRWGRKIFFSFLAWLRGEEGRTVGGRGAEKRIKWHPRVRVRVRVRVWRKPARGAKPAGQHQTCSR